MTLLLDTGVIKARDREQAIRAVLDGTTLPMRLEPTELQHRIDIRMRVWEFGALGTLFNAQGSGMRMQRTARHVATTDAPLISLSLQSEGRAHFSQTGELCEAGPGTMFLARMHEPYEYSWTGTGESTSVQLELDRLDLDHTDVVRASSRLMASPLYGLVRDHVLELKGCADSLDTANSSAMHATVTLVRALFISAAADVPANALDDQSRWEAALTHIRRHARTKALDASQVAKAVGTTAESLARLARAHGMDVDDLILARRLDGARRELTACRDPAGRIDWLARRWGFGDGDTFRRLFREHYAHDPEDQQGLAD